MRLSATLYLATVFLASLTDGRCLQAEEPQEPQTLHGEGRVKAIAFGPDGKTLATVTYEPYAVELWDVASGKKTATFHEPTMALWTVAFSPDGKTLASGGSDKAVRLWDVTTGKNTATLEGHLGRVLSVAFSPDGKTIASGSFDQKLWDVTTGRERTKLQGNNNAVLSVAFSPDGKTVASGSGNGTVNLWEAASGKQLASLKGQAGAVTTVAFSPDGTILASGSDEAVKAWDVATGKERTSFEGSRWAACCVAFSPDGKTLAAAGGDRRTVKVWDTASGKEQAILWGHTKWVSSVAFSPDGKTLASGSDDRTVKLWNLPARTPPDQIVEPGPRVRAEGTQACATFGKYGTSPTLSPDWKSVASVGWQEVKLWDVAGGKNTWTYQASEAKLRHGPKCVAVSPNGTLLAVGDRDGTIQLRNAANGEKTAALAGHDDPVETLAFSPDGKTLASATYDGGKNTIKLWDVVSGKNTVAFKGVDNEGFLILAFSPDGKTLASNGYDKSVVWWEVASGRRRGTLRGHTDWVRCLAFSPDGKTLASSSDSSIKLWDLVTAKERATLQGHTEWIFSVAFSPDGRTLASGSEDNTIRLWDVASGKHTAAFLGHTDSVRSVAFSPDGGKLASTSSDESVKVWNVPANEQPRSRPSGSSLKKPVRIAAWSDAEQENLWTMLAEEDADQAYRGMQTLLAAPERAVMLMKEQLRPVLKAEAQQMVRLIGDLDNPEFVVREKATEELEKFAEQVLPALQKKLGEKASLEVHLRIEKLVPKIEQLTPESLRRIRTVEVLEHLGTAEAKKVLETLATGAEGAKLTEEAKASLARLNKRVAAK